MNKSARQKIVIIGCGNVAWHLAKHFYSLNRFSVFVYNHQPSPALKDFRTVLKFKTEAGLEKVAGDADYYFICVLDKFISRVSKKIKCEKPESIIIHTSGSAIISEINNKQTNKAVFYPVQTFSKMDIINWHEIPLILEATNRYTELKLDSLAKQFSRKTLFLSYGQRLKFHLAAVMVNNFTNALFIAALELIDKKQKNGDFKLLLPLIKQTIVKLERLDPISAQTGPAKRKDSLVMKKHLSLISKQNDMKKIYRDLSALIIKQQSHA